MKEKLVIPNKKLQEFIAINSFETFLTVFKKNPIIGGYKAIRIPNIMCMTFPESTTKYTNKIFTESDHIYLLRKINYN